MWYKTLIGRQTFVFGLIGTSSDLRSSDCPISPQYKLLPSNKYYKFSFAVKLMSLQRTFQPPNHQHGMKIIDFVEIE